MWMGVVVDGVIVDGGCCEVRVYNISVMSVSALSDVCDGMLSVETGFSCSFVFRHENKTSVTRAETNFSAPRIDIVGLADLLAPGALHQSDTERESERERGMQKTLVKW